MTLEMPVVTRPTQVFLVLSVHLSMQLFTPSLHHPFIHALQSLPSATFIPPPGRKSHTNTGSVIHPSVRRAISHPSNQWARGESGWSNQSGHVSSEEEETDEQQSAESRPTYQPSMTHLMCSSVSTHLPLRPHCFNSWLRKWLPMEICLI